MTFQEYLTAQAVLRNQGRIVEIGETIGKPKWREVWLLLASMVEPDLLIREMKRLVDLLLKSDSKAQSYLGWCRRREISDPSGYKRAAIRAFYFELLADFYFTSEPTSNVKLRPLQVD